jgi:hypothetical protein
MGAKKACLLLRAPPLRGDSKDPTRRAVNALKHTLKLAGFIGAALVSTERPRVKKGQRTHIYKLAAANISGVSSQGRLLQQVEISTPKFTTAPDCAEPLPPAPPLDRQDTDHNTTGHTRTGHVTQGQEQEQEQEKGSENETLERQRRTVCLRCGAPVGRGAPYCRLHKCTSRACLRPAADGCRRCRHHKAVRGHTKCHIPRPDSRQSLMMRYLSALPLCPGA